MCHRVAGVTEEQTKATSEGFRIPHSKVKLVYFTGGPTTGTGAIPSRLKEKKKKKRIIAEFRKRHISVKWLIMRQVIF